MEDALVPELNRDIKLLSAVLILVLMEDALVHAQFGSLSRSSLERS